MVIVSGRCVEWRGSQLARSWLYALSGPSLLISAFHGNTDALCVFFVVLSVFLLASRRSPACAGLALGLAVNVKLIPLLAVPALLATLPSARERMKFGFSTALACLPILLAVLVIGKPFTANVFGYRSFVEPWGPSMIFWNAPRLLNWYREVASLLLVGALFFFSVLQVRLRALSFVESALLSFCLLLTIAPGFGIQYLMYAGPLLLVASPRLFLGFSVFGTLMAVFWYGSFVVSWTPVATEHYGAVSRAATFFGGLTWVVLVVAVERLAMKFRRRVGSHAFAVPRA